MALWPTKKDQPDDPARPSPDGAADDAGELPQLTEKLGELAELLDRTNEQLAAYLIRRESKGVAGAGNGDSSAIPAARLDAMSEKLEAIDKAVRSLAERTPAEPSADALAPALGQISDGINAHHEAIAGTIGQLKQQLDNSIRQFAEMLRPSEPEKTDAPTAAGDWQRTILGSKLTDEPELAFQRQQLLDGVLSGAKAARSLAGQLLVFQSAPPEKMAPLLKEIGEAYYRWQPKTGSGSNNMEEALAAWLKDTCDEAGIGNSIELVHPGERFDSTRHSSAQPGVEVAQVLGWIVLRDNGRVYTKATVVVR